MIRQQYWVTAYRAYNSVDTVFNERHSRMWLRLKCTRKICVRGHVVQINTKLRSIGVLLLLPMWRYRIPILGF